jgi:hypothetical protein
MMSFVICHDKQAGVGGRGGGEMAHERQKDEDGVRRKNTSKEKIEQISK